MALHESTGYQTHQEHWAAFWVDYQNEYPTENMHTGLQYTVTCQDFKLALEQHIMFLWAGDLDRGQDILYLTNMELLLRTIVGVAQRMNRENPDHPAVINRGVNHWDGEFERLCDERLRRPMGEAVTLLLRDDRIFPSAEVDDQVAGILQGALGVANILLSDNELPKDFGHRVDGVSPDYERLSDVLPSDFGQVDR